MESCKYRHKPKPVVESELHVTFRPSKTHTHTRKLSAETHTVFIVLNLPSRGKMRGVLLANFDIDMFLNENLYTFLKVRLYL